MLIKNLPKCPPMNQPTIKIKKLSLAIMLATLACGTLMAQQMSGPFRGPMGPATMAVDSPAAIIYSNLTIDPCTGLKYDSNNGFLVLGPNNCGIAGATQWLANGFIATRTQAVTRVTLAVTNWSICTPTSNKFTVQIYDDANCNGTPSNPLGSAVNATSPAAPPATATANFGTTGPVLTAGQRYYVVVTTSAAANQMATTAVWWEANTLSNEPFNLNDGNGWLAGNTGAPGGFQVQ